MSDFLIPASLLVASWAMYGLGYRLQRTLPAANAVGLAVLAALAAYLLLPKPQRELVLLAVYLVFIALILRQTPWLAIRHPASFGHTLLRVDRVIAQAHMEAVREGMTGSMTDTEAIEIYRQAVERMRALRPPPGTWTTLTNERIAMHDLALAYLSDPGTGAPAIKVLSAEWRAKVEAQMQAGG